MDINTTLTSAMDRLPYIRALKHSWKCKAAAVGANIVDTFLPVYALMVVVGIIALNIFAAMDIINGLVVSRISCLLVASTPIAFCCDYLALRWLNRTYLRPMPMKMMFSKTSATDKMDVIDTCQLLNVSDDVLQRLCVVATDNDNDVPNGWWQWVKMHLDEPSQQIQAQQEEEARVKREQERERVAQERLQSSVQPIAGGSVGVAVGPAIVPPEPIETVLRAIKL